MGFIDIELNYKLKFCGFEDAMTSAPDDGRKGRPKHAEHTCSC